MFLSANRLRPRIKSEGGLRRNTRYSLAMCRRSHYIDRAGLRGAYGVIFSGPYRSLRELSLAGPVGSVTWRPPTFVGNPGSLLQRLSGSALCPNESIRVDR